MQASSTVAGQKIVQGDLLPREVQPQFPLTQMVRQHNDLMRGRYDDTHPSLNCTRVLRVGMMKVDRHAESFDWIHFTAHELRKIFPALSRQNSLFETCNDVADEAMKIIITLRKPGSSEFEKFHLVDKAKFKKGVFSLRFDDDVKPYLLAVKRNITFYPIGAISNLPTPYSIRLYEVVRSHLWQGQVKYTLEDLKSLLGVPPGSYERSGNLMMRVIRPALNEINKVSDIDVVAEPIKEGKSIVALSFMLSLKSSTKLDPLQRAAVELLMKLPMEAKQANKLVASFGAQNCVEQYSYFKKKQSQGQGSEIQNPVGYLTKAIIEDYQLPSTDEARKIILDGFVQLVRSAFEREAPERKDELKTQFERDRLKPHPSFLQCYKDSGFEHGVVQKMFDDFLLRHYGVG